MSECRFECFLCGGAGWSGEDALKEQSGLNETPNAISAPLNGNQQQQSSGRRMHSGKRSRLPRCTLNSSPQAINSYTQLADAGGAIGASIIYISNYARGRCTFAVREESAIFSLIFDSDLHARKCTSVYDTFYTHAARLRNVRKKPFFFCEI